MKPVKTFDHERFSLNLAKLKKGGEIFEVIIHPDKIIEYKKKKGDVKEVMVYDKIFYDAKKGLEASTEHMTSLFGSHDPYVVGKIILDMGEIQFTQEYREQKRKEKMNRIIDIIARNAVDPRTGLPHPRIRIESAMEEARVKIDDLKEAEDQVNHVLDALKPIMPIKFAVKEIMVKIQSHFAGKAHSTIERFGKIVKSDWLSDGSWLGSVEIPAGLQNEFFDAINSLTHGTAETQIIK